MTAQKHTPGPWVVSPLSEMIFSAYMGDHQRPIGFIYGPAFAERSEVGRTAIANAVLCAAAPNMLEALYEAEEYFDNRADADHDGTGFVPNEEMKLLTVVRAAIAKATGQ
ncbi:hypothetical protein [Pelagibacterium sediminicola]|uniref:hypothetical protein n=1 Tax=Pelagibacterium sediminicola TaxID=2248761 RepID=UPI0013007D1F|nr:hypothetical protein [Pelagibacterium sediminicola]